MTGWHRRMRAFSDELWKLDPDTGSMELFAVTPNELREVMAAVQTGRSLTPPTAKLVDCIGQYLTAIAQSKKPLCAACDHEFANPAEVRAFLVGRAAFSTAGGMLISGVCAQCAERGPEELLDIYFRDLKKTGLAKEKLHGGHA
jgi:hypothetical protein